MMSPVNITDIKFGLFRPTNAISGLVVVTAIVLSLLWYTHLPQRTVQAEIDATYTVSSDSKQMSF